MSLDPYSRQAANADFDQARFRAALGHVLARLTRGSDELLSYEQVAQQLRLAARSERGIQTIPVAAIVGSVGRANDFTRSFLPRRAEDKERWAQVRNAFLDPSRGGLPAIEVYQVGEAYFVVDGNHRVSVARREGVAFIEAHVIEIRTPVPFTPDMTADDLICKAELAEFLDETGLGDSSFGYDFRTTQCGQYPKLRERIAVHQHIATRTQHRELSVRQAAADWLATVYAPLVGAIREHNLLEWFPDHTETDLFLWVTEHQHRLEEELGWAIRPQAAMTDLAVSANRRAKTSETAPGRWHSERLTERYLARLFNDLLVPLNDTPDSFYALEQAIVIAAKEEARIRALHIVRREQDKDAPAVRALESRFRARCAEANVTGELAVESGHVGRKVCERALLTDLIVLRVSERGRQSPVREVLLARGSDRNFIFKNAARPILLAARQPSPMEHALVIFDGSPKSQEALFIAAYMGENWKTALTVLVTSGGTLSMRAALDHARMYLELHELEAEYVTDDGKTASIAPLIAERNLDLLVTGKESASMRGGGRGDAGMRALLREPPVPVLTCG